MNKENTVYLSDLIDQLPKNCLYDKGNVGCGGTTLAIEGAEPYVILEPYTSVVVNKSLQYPNERCNETLFAVYEGVSTKDVEEYLDDCFLNHKTVKIISTYDGLRKIIEASYGKLVDYNLLVDEYHILFTQYMFRKEVIKTILDHYKQFMSYTFMTATPLEKAFVLDELRDIRIVKQEWNEEAKMKMNITALHTPNFTASAVKLINYHLHNETDYNLYIYMNSVKGIGKLIEQTGLNEANCRVICSRSSNVRLPVPISSVDDSKPKKFNFLTATAFEGCDIMDKKGKSYILSDPWARTTQLDICTSVRQISGRIRDSIYRGKVVHLFEANKLYNRGVSHEEYEKAIANESRRCKNLCEKINMNDVEVLDAIPEKLNAPYIIKGDDGHFSFDANLPKIDLFRYKVLNIYNSIQVISSEYESYEAAVKLLKDRLSPEDISLIAGAKMKDGFESIVRSINESTGLVKTLLLRDASAEYPFIRDALKYLGFEEMRRLKFNQKRIKEELTIIDPNIRMEKTVSELLGYKNGQYVPSKRIKKDLSDVFNRLGIRRSTTATTINRYYLVEEKTRRTEGRRETGYIIVAPIE